MSVFSEGGMKMTMQHAHSHDIHAGAAGEVAPPTQEELIKYLGSMSSYVCVCVCVCVCVWFVWMSA